MNRIIAILFATGVILILAGCGSDASTGPAPVTGVYELRDVGGVVLPAPIFEGLITDPAGDFFLRIVVTGGSLELRAGGRYEQRVNRSVFIDGQPAPGTNRTDRGIYTLSGDSIRFESDFIQGVQFSGTLTQGQIEVVQDLSEENRSMTYRYRK